LDEFIRWVFEMNEFLAIAGLLSMPVMYLGALWYFIRFKNKRINRRIEILYCMGMAETAIILQTPILKYWRK